MIKFILWCATGVFYALSWACAWFAVQSLMVYFHGVPSLPVWHVQPVCDVSGFHSGGRLVLAEI